MINKVPNSGTHIQRIVDTTSCNKHSASEGTSCWTVFIQSSQRYGAAVCGSRIRSAGFVGTIDPFSLSRGPVFKKKHSTK